MNRMTSVSRRREAKSRRKRRSNSENASHSEHVGLQESLLKNDWCNLFANACRVGNFVPSWYWSNYYKAVEWQNMHKLALRRSHAVALEQEKMYMLEEFELYSNPNSGTVDGSDCCRLSNVNKYSNKIIEKSLTDCRESEINKDDMAFEMSEEMIKFFEQSIRHKLEMNKQKDVKKRDSVDLEISNFYESHIQREKEMKQLYGDGSSMIVGMETAIQLSYDKYCDVKSPKYWPNIPFNL